MKCEKKDHLIIDDKSQQCANATRDSQMRPEIASAVTDRVTVLQFKVV